MKLQYKSKQLVKVSEIDIPSRFFNRIKTGVTELDNLFGNGILPGLTFTLAAQPGTGKTTFLLQLLDGLQKQGYRAGYFTGEEDVQQVAYTCRRLMVTEVGISNETDIDSIIAMMNELDIIVIDSFTCLTGNDTESKTQREKHMVEKLIKAAEETNCAVGIILHVTKSGDYKGTTFIPHAVGANFKLERDPENDERRMISSSKNRYGSTGNLIVDFGAAGFNFTTCRAQETADKAPSKADVRKVQMEKVLNFIDPPGISMERVVNELEVTRGQAYVILKELTTLNKLKKFGRGDNARWKRVLVATK